MTFRPLLAISLVSSAVLLSACQQEEAPAPVTPLETNEQKLSYSIGQGFAGQLQQSGIAIDVEALKAGVDDAFSKADPRVTPEEVKAAQEAIMQEMQSQQQLELDETAEKNAAESKAFLAENASKDGVKTTESGLQYTVVTQGDGEIPSATDTVSVHYQGTLVDGTKFDSSYDRGEPAQFPVSAVIKGWTEALTMMPVGSKYMLYIPSELAYGPGGTGPIGPNAALIFEVELLAIVK